MRTALILMTLVLLVLLPGCESISEYNQRQMREAIRAEADRARIEGLRRDMDHLLRHRR